MRQLGLIDIRVDRRIRDLIGDIIAAVDPALAGVGFDEWDAFRERHPDVAERGDDADLGREAINLAASDRDVATPRHMARLCAMIAEKDCASEQSCEEMLGILGKQLLNGRLPRDLPSGGSYAHKTGTLGSGAVVNDAGILYIEETPVASVAVLSRDVRDPIHQTNGALARLGRTVYDHYAG